MFLYSKRNHQQNKQTVHRMVENLLSYTLDNELISKVYKELQKLNTKKLKLPVNKLTNELNWPPVRMAINKSESIG